MPDMKHPRWPHLERRVSRHGKVCWYVRRGHSLRTRLRGGVGTPEFEAEYLAALRGETPSKRKGLAAGTLGWSWERYCDLSAWSGLSDATRRQRENIMKHVLKAAANAPLAEITKRVIVAGRERRQKTPSAANNYLNTMRHLFAWAVEAELVKSNPVDGVKMLTRPKSGGFRVWSEEEIDRFEAHWPLGTRARVAFAVYLYTGLRRGDAARLGRQHVKNGLISIDAEKTGTTVTIPVHPKLAEAIRARKPKGLTFIETEEGGPMKKESLGNWFREICDAAGCKASAHGLRKRAATRLAKAGANFVQLRAYFGWTTDRMPSLYTQAVEREEAALAAAAKAGASGAVIPLFDDED